MKAFKIKKHKNKRKTFVADEMITNFPKPKLPFVFFTKINPPRLLPAAVQVEP